MTERVRREDIEDIVGTKRHRTKHYARAVSKAQKVYILHSELCLDKNPDLRDCEYSKALDNGIDEMDWKGYEDRPCRVDVFLSRLVPVIDITGQR